MSLVAKRALQAGEQLTLNYGRHSLRSMLRTYGFAPPDSAFEASTSRNQSIQAAHHRDAVSQLPLHQCKASLQGADDQGTCCCSCLAR